MNVHEFGKENGKVIVLIHPSAVTWEYFIEVIPYLEKDFHLFVPALPGYDLENGSQFSSVEKIASELGTYLSSKGISTVDALYGCSMGGSIVLRMALEDKIKAKHYIMDGGITPYQLPYILTRLIALRDFCMVSLGKIGGIKIISKAFHSTRLTEEDLQYISKILDHCSYKTLWNTFDSCNNFRMPKTPLHIKGSVHYWYGEKERKARDWDLKYMKKFVPETVFKKFKGLDHGDLAPFYPKLLAESIRRLTRSCRNTERSIIRR